MKKIEVVKNGYEIVVTIPTIADSPIIEADAYYKDFENYRILILADCEKKAVEFATKELLTNHPFEQIIHDL